METELPVKKKKSPWPTVIFVAANALVIGWTAIREFAGSDGADRFGDVEIRWLLLIPALLCLAAAVALETWKYALVMRATCGRVDRSLARRTVLIGRYYDNVTPSGVGGQPFQIYYMKKNGVPNGPSAAIPVAGFLSMQFGFILLALLVLLCGGGTGESEVVRVAAAIGLFFYSFFPVVIILFALFPHFARRVTGWTVSLLARMHLVKNKEESAENFIANVDEYSRCLKELLKNGRLCLQILALGFAYQAVICSIPFFVILAFGGEVGFFESLATTALIYAAITFIPTPGNAGAAEGMFYAVFSMLTTGYIFWAMLTWRFFVFYLFILAGLLLHAEDALRARIETRRRLREARREAIPMPGGEKERVAR
ncbi:MAG: flippase-like domain-containing protein [Oscillospiraceae bacterium]|nr:flippase-like domain-containing protein [Oscillospiraceae bacterium]